ncbi:unnamed protein product [Danaus chrysippus]|uniref:(African queen) hypothetical protein n=1 Tax=Danaus chrysippus TaxID=151541 RepID=A0A8J2VPM6_9NEOP|nr:unnamed protein product [Danaus chrysippus]
MALRLQIEKKKAQEEMRRLMAERKNKSKKPTQINNPLAKYNNAGQLMCVLCSSIVRSENVWQVHLNSKQHRENIEKAKKLKQLTNNFTDDKIKKRQSSCAIDQPPEKKIKGILKNAPEKINTFSQTPNNDAPIIFSHHDEEIKRKVINPMAVDEAQPGEKSEEQGKPELTAAMPIPEGFFDDPILDAKCL